MRFIVDTNQALKLRPDIKITSPIQAPKRIVVVPNVIGEILLRPDPKPTLKHLEQFHIIYGLEPADSLRRVCSLTEPELSRFQPFAYPEVSLQYKEFYAGLRDPQPKHLEWARRVKDGNKSFCSDMFSRAIRIRQIIKSGSNTKAKRYDDLNEAKTDLSSFFMNLIVSCISHGGKRQALISQDQALFTAVMKNQHLAGLFNTLLFYTVSWARAWKDQRMNFDPAPTRDDWVDITLALYASDGDCILTEDDKLRAAIQTVHPGGEVLCGDASRF